MIPEIHEMKITNHSLFNEMCYLIDTMNSMIIKTQDMSRVYQFLQNVKNGYKTDAEIALKTVYNLRTIDVDIARINKELKDHARARDAFVVESKDRLIQIMKALDNRFVPYKTDTLYQISYRGGLNRRYEDKIVSKDVIDYGSGVYQFEQMLR